VVDSLFVFCFCYIKYSVCKERLLKSKHIYQQSEETVKIKTQTCRNCGPSNLGENFVSQAR